MAYIYILEEEYIGLIGKVKCENGAVVSEINFQLYDDQETNECLDKFGVDKNGNFILKGDFSFKEFKDQKNPSINPTFELYLIIKHKCNGEDKSIRYDIKNLQNMKTIRIKDTIILS